MVSNGNSEHSQKKIVHTFYSIRDIINMPRVELETKVFSFGYKNQDKFVQIKKRQFSKDEQSKIVIQTIDISKSILYDQSKAHQEF